MPIVQGSNLRLPSLGVEVGVSASAFLLAVSGSRAVHVQFRNADSNLVSKPYQAVVIQAYLPKHNSCG